jgi:hypothetical protein
MSADVTKFLWRNPVRSTAGPRIETGLFIGTVVVRNLSTARRAPKA